MKKILFVLAILSLIILAGCVDKPLDLPPEPPAPGNIGDMQADMPLDVISTAECEALEGHSVNAEAGYECEPGETAIGSIDEHPQDYICCAPI